jgi:endonuclease YncB( thermonuclease family)
MRVILFCVLLLSQASSAYGPYKAELVRVIDGDTIDVTIELWPGLTQRARIRLEGVNTPEKRTRLQCEKKAGIAATEFTQAFVDKGAITVDGVRNGKFAGRVLGKVFVDGNSLSDALLVSGHARHYSGGKRLPWCD